MHTTWQTGGARALWLTAFLLVLSMAFIAASSGGPPPHAVELGAQGVLLSLLGIAGAARIDGRDDGNSGEAHYLRPALASGVLIVAFLALAGIVRLGVVQAFDVELSHRAYHSGGALTTGLLRGLSKIGGRDLLVYWVPVIALLLAVARRPRELAVLAASMFGVLGLEAAAKAAAHRLRPDLVRGVHFDSFPSGHTLAAAVLAGTLLVLLLPMVRRRGARALLWTAALLWPVLMGASRVYLGAHFLTDVIGGMLLGAAWVLGCRALLLALPPVTRRGGKVPE